MKVLFTVSCFLAISYGAPSAKDIASGCKKKENLKNGSFKEFDSLLYGKLHQYTCENPYVSNVAKLEDITFFCDFHRDIGEYVWIPTEWKFQNHSIIYLHNVRCEAKKECLDPPLPEHMTRVRTVQYQQAVIARDKNTHDSRFYDGDILVYSCQTGYEIKNEISLYNYNYYDDDEAEDISPLNIVCSQDGKWSGQDTFEMKFEECKAVVCDAGRFRDMRNGNITAYKEIYDYGKIMELSCNDGYEPIGGITSVRCESFFSFSDLTLPYFGCEPITCAEPANPKNGRIHLQGLYVGDTVTFYCESGYKLIGAPVWTCQANGKWDATCTRCESEDYESYCQAPCIPPGSDIVSVDRTFDKGTVLEFTCKDGIYYGGSKERTCMQNRQWSGTPIDCTGESLFHPDVGNTLLRALKQQVPYENDTFNETDNNPDQMIAKSIRIGGVGGVDVYLLVDVSKSITSDKFNSTIQFLDVLLPELGISDDSRGTRLALYFFATKTKRAFNQHYADDRELFTDFTEAQKKLDETISSRDQIQDETKSGTAITAALKDVKVDLETKMAMYMSGTLRQAQQVIILLSDGKFTTDGDPTELATELKENPRFKALKVEIYSIAVGDREKDRNGFKTMEKLASEIPGEQHYFPIDLNGDFSTVLKEMIRRTDYNLSCGQTKPKLTNLKNNTEQYEHNARKDAWPWMAELLTDKEHKCGGSLIDHQWILTAAHCFDDVQIKKIHLRKLKRTDADGFRSIPVAEGDKRIHPSYNKSLLPKHKYDIALVKLQEKIVFEQWLLPVCLWNEEIANATRKPYSELFLPEISYGVVTGWGKTDTQQKQDDLADTLKQMQMSIKSHKDCVAKLTAIQKQDVDENLMFCAGGSEETKDGKKFIDACSGDSGGPFVVEHPTEENRYIQIGIVSFGFGCKQEGKYGFYTRLTPELLEWISNTIKQ